MAGNNGSARHAAQPAAKSTTTRPSSKSTHPSQPRAHWPTQAKVNEISAMLKDQGNLTLEELAICIVRSGLTNEHPTINQFAVRNLISMKGQNQKEDQIDLARENVQGGGDQHLHIHGSSEERLDAILDSLKSRLETHGGAEAHGTQDDQRLISGPEQPQED